MESSTLGKIVGAFLAGCILSLGTAMLVNYSDDSASPITQPVLAASHIVQGKAPASRSAPERQADSEPVVGSSSAVEPEAIPVNNKDVTVARATVKKGTPAGAQSPVPSSGSASWTAEPRVAAVESMVVPNVPAPPAPAVTASAAPLERQAPAPQPHVVTLPAGTAVTVRLGETLVSDRITSGDTFRAVLDAPIIAEGFIIADRGAGVVGRVVESNPAGRVKGLSNLVLTLSEINTTDRQRVVVQTDTYEKWGSAAVKQEAAKIAGGAALGAIIGALAGGGKGAAIGAGAGGAAGTGVVLGTRGASAAVATETLLSFRLTSPVTITEQFQ